jgi:flavodoxin
MILKAVVVYDTYYGNTKRVAEAIVEQVKADGHEVEIKSLRDDPSSPAQADVLFVGSPIRFGGPTGRVKKFVKRLDKGAWSGRPVVVFTTVSEMPKEPATEKQKQSFDKWALGGGRKLRDLAKTSGFNALENYLWVEVVQNDTKTAVLVPSGIEKTKQFTHEIMQSVKR